jgi:hypothetical protein
MRLLGKVEPPSVSLANGTERELLLAPGGGLVSAPGAADYAEAVRAGRVFAGMTAVTGVAPGTAIGTTAAFSLYNPLKSGKNLVVLRAAMGYVSGTLGAGSVVWVANTNTAAVATTGTAITAVNTLLGSSQNAVGRPLTTATVPATPTVLYPFCSLGASLETTAIQPWKVIEEVKGGLAVAPGATLSLEGVAAAGSSPLVVFGLLWEEVPV